MGRILIELDSCILRFKLEIGYRAGREQAELMLRVVPSAWS